MSTPEDIIAKAVEHDDMYHGVSNGYRTAGSILADLTNQGFVIVKRDEAVGRVHTRLVSTGAAEVHDIEGEDLILLCQNAVDAVLGKEEEEK